MKTIKHYTKYNGKWYFTAKLYCEDSQEFSELCKKLDINPLVKTNVQEFDRYEIETEIINTGIIFKYQLSYVYSIN